MGFRSGRYAAIDIGTVTCRLLVADVDGQGALVELLHDREVTNLGAGVDESGMLAPDAIERVGRAVDRFADEVGHLAQTVGAIPTTAIATSAARDAGNAELLAARLARAGVSLQIIPGDREASLSFMGATSVFPGGSAVVIDVGGGSTEVIAGRTGSAPSKARSFQIGCRRITERFFREDPPSPEQLQRAGAFIASEASPYLAELKAAGWLDGRVIAVAGTATSVISMRDSMEVYDPELVHASTASRADLDALLARLCTMPLAEREKVTGLEPRRAPVIVAGLLILQQVMETGAIEQFTASESDILQGIVLEAART